MASSKRNIGSFIAPVSLKNREGKYSEVLGVAIEKEFMPSVANLIGTDLKKYSIVSKNEFAFNPMHVGRDKRLPIALYRKDVPALVSPAYSIFKVVDNNVELEYLMLIFKSNVFDHLCWFHTDSSVRGGLTWEDFCNLEIDLPDIEEQRKIVKEYQTIQNKIKLLEKENNILKQLGILNISNIIGFDTLVNKSERELEELVIPPNCSITTINEFCKKITSGGTPSRDYPEYYNGNINWLKSGEVHNNIIEDTEEKISDSGLKNSSAKLFPKNTVLMAMYGVTAGEAGFLDIETSTNQAICGLICNNFDEAAFLFFTLLKNQMEIKRLANGGAQDNLNQDIIKGTKIIVPNDIKQEKLHCRAFMNRLITNAKYLHQLRKMLNLLLLKIS